MLFLHFMTLGVHAAIMYCQDVLIKEFLANQFCTDNQCGGSWCEVMYDWFGGRSTKCIILQQTLLDVIDIFFYVWSHLVIECARGQPNSSDC